MMRAPTAAPAATQPVPDAENSADQSGREGSLNLASATATNSIYSPEAIREAIDAGKGAEAVRMINHNTIVSKARVEQERQRAEHERQRADEAELGRGEERQRADEAELGREQERKLKEEGLVRERELKELQSKLQYEFHEAAGQLREGSVRLLLRELDVAATARLSYDLPADTKEKSASTSAYLNRSTKGWVKPHNVLLWEDLDIPEVLGPLGQASTVYQFFTPRRDQPFLLNWSERDMRGHFGDSFVDTVIVMAGTAASAPEEIHDQLAALRLRHENKDSITGLQPDTTLYSGAERHDESAISVIEAKSPKYGAQRVDECGSMWAKIPGPVANPDFALEEYWAVYEAAGCVLADFSGVTQIYNYMAESGLQYGVLFTGHAMWLLKRVVDGEDDDLLVSRTIRATDTSASGAAGASMAQALLALVVLAIEDPKLAAPQHVMNELETVRSLRRDEKAANKAGGDGVSAAAAEGTGDGQGQGASGGKGGGGAVAAEEAVDGSEELPLEEVCFRVRPVDTFTPGEHGVVHRLDIHGHDAVLKLVDAHKDEAGAQRFQAEGDRYLQVRHLWGKAVPSLVFAGPVCRGRFAVATLYAGRALALAPELMEGKAGAKVRERARIALRALHEAGLAHGDVALRNMAADEGGRVLFIDLGRARVLGSEEEAQAEREQLEKEFPPVAAEAEGEKRPGKKWGKKRALPRSVGAPCAR